MTIIEEDLVRAEVRLQDMKESAQPVSAPSGVAEGIMGAIRKTSGAFSNTFHMMAPALPELKVEIPQLPTAEHQVLKKAVAAKRGLHSQISLRVLVLFALDPIQQLPSIPDHPKHQGVVDVLHLRSSRLHLVSVETISGTDAMNGHLHRIFPTEC
ncbi:unnamed protein product [Nippostrongylus brasiliensis]|uniref:Dynein light chain n=1 Tax=Nippostrongylus brasiliensis TaxID=27835 RepID=A0A0N4YRM4_NIPBR|nr:unnamed protein product [Nippostrongylus brasiliensis]